MQFEKNLQYHIYNQGNNRQKVFFEPRNYLYFITKMREFILPHADILCCCLMPNHFHILVNVHNVHLSAHNSSEYLNSTFSNKIQTISSLTKLDKRLTCNKKEP